MYRHVCGDAHRIGKVRESPLEGRPEQEQHMHMWCPHTEVSVQALGIIAPGWLGGSAPPASPQLPGPGTHVGIFQEFHTTLWMLVLA